MNCWHRTNGFLHLYSLLNVSGGHLLAGWNSRKRPRFKHGIYWLCNHMQVTVKPSVLVCLYKVVIVMSALTLRESQWDQCICLDDKACMLQSGHKASIVGAICSLQLPVLPSRGRQDIMLLKSPSFRKGSQLLNKIGRASWLKVYNVKGMLGLPWWYTRGYNLGTEGRINLREEKSQVLSSDLQVPFTMTKHLKSGNIKPKKNICHCC